MQAIGATRHVPVTHEVDQPEPAVHADSHNGELEHQLDEGVPQSKGGQPVAERTSEALLTQARREDAAHRVAHQKPISADTLRVRLGIGAARARQLVKIVRSEFEEQVATQRPACEVVNEIQEAATMAA